MRTRDGPVLSCDALSCDESGADGQRVDRGEPGETAHEAEAGTAPSEQRARLVENGDDRKPAALEERAELARPVERHVPFLAQHAGEMPRGRGHDRDAV